MSKDAPLPTWEVNGRPRVFSLANENHRSFLTGGLPPPTFTQDGSGTCMYCDTRVPVVSINTHVPGASHVRAHAPHPCKPKAAV